MGLIIGCSCVVLVSFVGGMALRAKILSTINVEKIETLSMKEIIEYFKEPKVLAKLKDDANKIAVAIKENSKDFILVTACLFDKEKNEASRLPPIRKWQAKTLSSDLEETFGDKNMIVLQ